MNITSRAACLDPIKISKNGSIETVFTNQNPCVPNYAKTTITAPKTFTTTTPSQLGERAAPLKKLGRCRARQAARPPPKEFPAKPGN